MLGWRRWR